MPCQAELEDLKNIFTHPRYYLSNYFSDIRHEVDSEFVRKDLKETNPQIKTEIKKNWVEMISKIDSFEQECFNKQTKNSFDNDINAKQTSELINLIETELNNKDIDEQSIKNRIYDEILKLEKVLFLNKLMVFLPKQQGYYSVCKRLDMNTNVGILIYITNDYLGRITIEALKTNQLNNIKKDRLTNELIKIMKLKEKLVVNINSNQIVEINLSLNNWNTIVLSKEKIKEIHQKTFTNLNNLKALRLNNNLIERIDQELFNDLTNLTDICLSNNKLTQIHKDIFQNCQQLKEIWLNNNMLTEIHKELFKNLINLTTIRLENNELKELDSNIFDGLVNLKQLSLSKNQLKSIDKNILKELTSLEWIDLSKNQIETIDKNLFKYNLNLINIDLKDNQLAEIDSTIFNNLTKLNTIDLGHNKLTKIDSDLFKSLNEMLLIELGNNQIEQINKSAFKNLVNLTELYLNDNELSVLDKDLFQDLKCLKIIFLSNNQLKQIDKFTFKDLKCLIRINLLCNLFSDKSELELIIEDSVKYVLFKTNSHGNNIDSVVFNNL